jgi:hypothetical protein
MPPRLVRWKNDFKPRSGRRFGYEKMLVKPKNYNVFYTKTLDGHFQVELSSTDIKSILVVKENIFNNSIKEMVDLCLVVFNDGIITVIHIPKSEFILC